MSPRRPAELWTIPIRLLTPAFIGGAAPNERADLRPAGIRGALRAWYRLLVGPEVAAGLAEAHPALRESRLFGGVGKGEGQGLLSLSLMGPPLTGDMPWSNRDHRNRNPGLAYLGFALDMSPNTRKALRPGSRFALRLSFTRGLSEDDAALLLHTLGLWLALGGLGTRSRRGFGSLWLDGPPSFTDLAGRPLQGAARALALPVAPAGPAAGTAIKALLTSAAALRGRLGLGVPVDTAEHHKAAGPAYHLRLSGVTDPRRSRARLWLGAAGQGWSTYEAALNAVGEGLQLKRRELGVDGVGGSALRLLSERRLLPRAPRRVAFGAPLTLRPLGPRTDLKLGTFNLLPVRLGREQGEFEVAGRAPSPLLISVVPAGQGFGLALTLLSGPWPGRDLPIVATEGGGNRGSRISRGFMPLDPQSSLPADFIGALPRAEDLWP
jgi:hypothetical protein